MHKEKQADILYRKRLFCILLVHGTSSEYKIIKAVEDINNKINKRKSIDIYYTLSHEYKAYIFPQVAMECSPKTNYILGHREN